MKSSYSGGSLESFDKPSNGIDLNMASSKVSLVCYKLYSSMDCYPLQPITVHEVTEEIVDVFAFVDF